MRSLAHCLFIGLAACRLAAAAEGEYAVETQNVPARVTVMQAR